MDIFNLYHICDSVVKNRALRHSDAQKRLQVYRKRVQIFPQPASLKTPRGKISRIFFIDKIIRAIF